MDDKSKKKKKKLKQKQKQKQQQSVVVNVNLAKSRNKSASERNPQNARVQLPPPIHKVYASPIHDLTPQNFNKEGKQIAQPSLAEQMLEKYLQKQEQVKQANVLGSVPQPNIALAQTSSPKKANRTPLRPIIQPDEQLVSYAPSDTEAEPVNLEVKQKAGRKKGSKNKPKINATEVVSAAEVMGVAETIEEPALMEKKYIPNQLPDEFFREQMLLRQPQNPDNIYSRNRYDTPFTSPRQPEQPLNAPNPSKKNNALKKVSLLFAKDEDEE
jgi:hypothetical protein